MRPDIDDLPNQFPVQLHHQVQFRHKGRIVTEAVEHIVLRAPGAVDIPEGFPDQVFYGPVVLLGFTADDQIVC